MNQQIQDRIFSLFINGIVLCNTKEKATALLEDIFTPTERIMLAKRFSIAYMLTKKYDYRTISRMLKVSKSTIGTVSLWLHERGRGIRYLVKSMQEHEQGRIFLEDLTSTFLAMIAAGKKVKYPETTSRRPAF
jgi:uncharacterized protein YerC